jgi:transposase
LHDNVVEIRLCYRRSNETSYAKLIDTICGVGPVSALAIASEIGDVNRFPNEFKLFAYAGLVPRIYQSGNRDFKGHITKGDVLLKTMLLQCVPIHIKRKPNSPIAYAYNNIKVRAGKKKAKVGAAKRLLRTIYWMLKRDEEYHDQ